MKKDELNKKINNVPAYLKQKIDGISEYDLNDLSIKDQSHLFRKKVINEGFRIRQLYAIYYQGWEMDNFGCIAEKNDEIFWITTNHGNLEIQHK